MIRQFDKDGNGALEFDEFEEMMKPKIYDSLLEQDDRDQEFRNMFLEADTDYSGYLSAKEIYMVMLKNGIQITMEELIDLITEFDHDDNAEIDIDEFVQMMNLGQEAEF